MMDTQGVGIGAARVVMGPWAGLADRGGTILRRTRRSRHSYLRTSFK
jgi:hypothetical protein